MLLRAEFVVPDQCIAEIAGIKAAQALMVAKHWIPNFNHPVFKVGLFPTPNPAVECFVVAWSRCTVLHMPHSSG